jgi:hypothetical protein
VTTLLLGLALLVVGGLGIALLDRRNVSFSGKLSGGRG